MASKNEVNKAATTDLNDLNHIPEYLRGSGAGLGNENVKQDDVTIPRLLVLQSNSPQLEPDGAKFIPGAKMGDLVNSLTGQNYGEQLRFVDVYYQKEYAVFVKRTAGGGFRGSAATPGDAVAILEAQPNKDQCEVIETAQHYCLLVDDAGNPLPAGEIVLSMTSTKLKTSRKLNGLIRARGGDRFAGQWVLRTRKDKNDKGTFYSLDVTPGPWVTEETYKTARHMYDIVSRGERQIDRGQDEAEQTEERF